MTETRTNLDSDQLVELMHKSPGEVAGLLEGAMKTCPLLKLMVEQDLLSEGEAARERLGLIEHALHDNSSSQSRK